MAYQRSTQARGFRNRVAPDETKRLSSIATGLEKNRVKDLKAMTQQANGIIAEQKRVNNLEAQADIYELNNLRKFSKELSGFLDDTLKNVVKPVVEGQINEGINEGIKASQGDEEALNAVKLSDQQELELKEKISEQRLATDTAVTNQENTWDEAGYEASLRQKYRLLNLKKQNSNFAIGFRKGLLMESATGWDAFRDSVLLGSSDHSLANAEVQLENGDTVKFSDYYSIKDSDVRTEILMKLQRAYIEEKGSGLSKVLVNKYLTKPVLERTNLFEQKEYQKEKVEFATNQLDDYIESLKIEDFAPFGSDNLTSDQTEEDLEKADLAIQEMFSIFPGIMKVLHPNGSYNAKAKETMMAAFIDLMKSDKYNNMDSQNDILDYLSSDRFYLPGVSKVTGRTEDGKPIYELSSMEKLFGSNFSRDNIQANLLAALEDEATKQDKIDKKVFDQNLSAIFTDRTLSGAERKAKLAALMQDERFAGKAWANSKLKQFDSSFEYFTPFSKEESESYMDELAAKYLVDEGGVIPLSLINVTQVDASVLERYVKDGAVGNYFEDDPNAKNAHVAALESLNSLTEIMFKDLEIEETMATRQKNAASTYYTNKLIALAKSYQSTNSKMSKTQAMKLAGAFLEQQLKAQNASIFDKTGKLNLGEIDPNIKLKAGVEGWEGTRFWTLESEEGIVSPTNMVKQSRAILERFTQLQNDSQGIDIFTTESIIKNPIFFKLVGGRPQGIFNELSKASATGQHPAVIYNKQLVLNGGTAVEWPETLQKEIDTWEDLTADVRKTLLTGDKTQINNAVRDSGRIDTSSLLNTFITPDGSIPISETEFARYLPPEHKGTTYEDFISNPKLVEKVLKVKLFEGIKLADAKTNNFDILLRMVSAHMLTGDIDNWNSEEYGDHTIAILNSYHTGSTAPIDKFFKNNKLNRNIFNSNLQLDQSFIGNNEDILTVDIATNLDDLNLQIEEFNKLEIPEKMQIINSYGLLENKNDADAIFGLGLASGTLRKLLNQHHDFEPNPAYVQWSNRKKQFENTRKVLNYLSTSNITDMLNNAALVTQFSGNKSQVNKKTNTVFPNDILTYVVYPAVKSIIGQERIDDIKDRALETYNNGESASFDEAFKAILTRQPEFANSPTTIKDTNLVGKINNYSIGGTMNGRVFPEDLVPLTGYENSFNSKIELSPSTWSRAFSTNLGGQILIRRDAYAEVKGFLDAANDAGVFIGLNEGYRSYEEQKRLFNLKESGVKFNDSAVQKPGNSNHGAGTAIDINWADKESFDWVLANHRKFNLCPHKNITPPNQDSKDPESWHFTWDPTGTCQVAIDER